MGPVWWNRRALLLHLTLAVVLPSFGALAWWQVDRALSGNSLSWMYVFEWPFFGAYAVYMWWRIIHERASDARAAEEAGAAGSQVPGPPPAGEAAVDAELDAYNLYLAELHAADAEAGAAARASRDRAAPQRPGVRPAAGGDPWPPS